MARPRPVSTVAPPVLDLPGLPDQPPPPGFDLGGGPDDAAEVLALPASPAPAGDSVVLGPYGGVLAEALGYDPFDLAEVERATGKVGELVTLPLAPGGAPGLHPDVRTVLLVGVGSGSGADLRRASAALARRCRDRGVVASGLAAAGVDAPIDVLDDVVAGTVLGSFGLHVRSTGPASSPAAGVRLLGVPDDARHRARLERACARAAAAWTARALATVPSNVKDPEWMAGRARAAADAATGPDRLTVRTWDADDLEREGFGGIVAVGRASASPPRLVSLDYEPRRASRRTPRVVLVGKGITFDTGGLSLKPPESMATMKRDMTGAAVVLAVLAALPAMGCPLRVTGLLPLAENAVDGDALRPGDVVRHWGGRTSEVTNTDAEGRLVLADALAYAVDRLDPVCLVDVATLTGAVKVALGQRTGGLFAGDDALASRLLAAGEAAGERLWRLPMTEDYVPRLDSQIADADNAPGGPGATIAALFLRPFTGGLPWAHLDIASVGDSPSDWHEQTTGPTGFGVRLLADWLCSDDPLGGVGDS